MLLRIVRSSEMYGSLAKEKEISDQSYQGNVLYSQLDCDSSPSVLPSTPSAVKLGDSMLYTLCSQP